MPETLTDEQILGLDDGAASEVSSEAPETTATVETTSQETAEQPPPRPPTEKAETLPGQKPADKTQPQAKPADQNAQTFEQLFPGGIEEARAAHAAAQEMYRADQAFLTGDLHGVAQTIETLFGENPQALADTVWVGLKALQEKAPEQLQQVLRYAVSEELGGQKVWDALEQIYAAAQKSGAREVISLVNGLAGRFQQYGLGPQSSEVQESSWRSYTKVSDELLTREIGNEIQRAFGVEFSSLAPMWQGELIQAAHGAIQDAMGKDPAIVRAVQKLKSAYTPQEAIKVFSNTLEPKARSLVPGIVQSLKRDYQNTEVFKSAAPAKKPVSRYAPAPAQAPAVRPPKSMAEADARGMSMAEILRSALSEEERAQAGNPLGLEEAARMSDSEILGTSRPVDRTAKITPRSGKLSREEARRMSYSELLNDDRGVE